MTDKELQKIEARLAKEYDDARKDVERKIKEHLEQFAELDKEYAEMVDSGKMKKKTYQRWRNSAMVRTDAWEDLRDVLASDLSHTNEIAMGIINDHAIDCYAMNMNYGTYEIENGLHINTSFSMYDHRTVENLMKDDPQVIPRAGLDIEKDKLWNRQKLTSALTQGILTGDSIPDIAKRLGEVADMNETAAVRNARTYTTAAENKGRVDSYERAQSMGIDLEQEWMATLDLRTRTSHRKLDGERVKIGAKFSNDCRYPGDPDGKPWEIYNCRCTLVAALKGFDDEEEGRFSRLPSDMSYEEWKGLHENSGNQSTIGRTGDKYTAEQRAEIEKLLAQAPEDVRKFWEQNVDDFYPTELPGKDDPYAYYDNINKKVHLTPDDVASNDGIHNPYENHFHEYGHNADNLSGGGGPFDYLSTNYRDKNGRTFEDIITEEWDKKFRPSDEDVVIRKFRMNLDKKNGGMGGYSFARGDLSNWRRINHISRDDPVFRALADELDSISDDDKKIEEFIKKHINVYSWNKDPWTESEMLKENLSNYCKKMIDNYSYNARGNLSDMLERYAVNNGGSEFPLGVGHGERYANRKGSLAKEAFAEMFSAEIANPESLDLIKQELPEAYAAYKDMLKGAIKR